MDEKSNEITSRLIPEHSLESVIKKLQDIQQISLYPMMINWCLSLKLLTSASYHALWSKEHSSFTIERTLRDYTHC